MKTTFGVEVMRTANDPPAIEELLYAPDPAIEGAGLHLEAIGVVDDWSVAEVAFSTARDWQGKGIASVILEKLAEAARENGFASLIAYMLPTNTGMIKLFKKLPYKVKSRFEGEAIVLGCDFDE